MEDLPRSGLDGLSCEVVSRTSFPAKKMEESGLVEG